MQNEEKSAQTPENALTGMPPDPTKAEENTLSPDADLCAVKGAVEAILFAAGYPVEYVKLSAVIGVSVPDLKSLLSDMADDYTDRGIQLLLFPDTCQLCTKEEYAPYIREALGIRRGGNLSASSMEVLAIVAYNQPVTRAFVDTVRGVDSSYAVTSLMDKELIAVCGRLDAPGRPMLYTTTDKFLRVFGLSSLSDLPVTEPLCPAVDTPSGTEDSKDESSQEHAASPSADIPPPDSGAWPIDGKTVSAGKEVDL